VAGIKQFQMKQLSKQLSKVFSATLAFCPNAPVLRGVMIAAF